MSRRSEHPRLPAVHVDDLLGLEHAFPDLEDFFDRHGMDMAPVDTRQALKERVLERFFVDRLYPWTSNGLDVGRKG